MKPPEAPSVPSSLNARIVALHQQGLSTAAIWQRLHVPSDYVRLVVSCEQARQLAARVEASRQARAAAQQTLRRTKAERKKAKALAQLQEAEAFLKPL